MRVGLIQCRATGDVNANLDAVEPLVRAAAAQGARTIVLPEAFAYIGPAAGRIAIAEDLDGDGPILSRSRELARETRCDLVLGGFPERCDAARTFNTLVHLGADGAVRARYRKIHLFDVALADGTVLDERTSTAAGDEAVMLDLPCGPTGASICYDVRFPQLYQQLVDAGAEVLLAPSAFTASTGRAHWHLLLRARAVECQAWMLAPAQCGDHGGGRRSFGHSLIVDPWGEVVLDLGAAEAAFGVVDVDPERTARVRAELPSLRHRRSFSPPRTEPDG